LLQVIQAFGLTSDSRKGLPPAVDDVSFEARAGHVTVLLGVPGAGKSTALRLMLELQQGRGLTYFRGRPLHRIAHPSREVGVLLGDVPGHPARTVRGHLRMLCAAAGVPVRRADEVLEVVGLVSLRDERLGTLSRGMDRRLGLACALLADPHTLVLDDPAEGLSARENRWLHGMLRAHAVHGGTVLLTTADPKEAARVADRVVTLERGRLVADQEATDFARTRLRPRVAVRSPHAARLAAVLTKEARAAHRSVEVVQEDGNRLSVYGSTCADVGETAFRNGILVHQLAHEIGDMGPEAGAEPHGGTLPERVGAALPLDERSPLGLVPTQSTERPVDGERLKDGERPEAGDDVRMGSSAPDGTPATPEGDMPEAGPGPSLAPPSSASPLSSASPPSPSSPPSPIEPAPAEILHPSETVQPSGEAGFSARPDGGRETSGDTDCPQGPDSSDASQPSDRQHPSDVPDSSDGRDSSALSDPSDAPESCDAPDPSEAPHSSHDPSASEGDSRPEPPPTTAVLDSTPVESTVDEPAPHTRPLPPGVQLTLPEPTATPGGVFVDGRQPPAESGTTATTLLDRLALASSRRRLRPAAPRALDALSALPPPISVRSAPSPLRPLRYELRRASGISTGFLTGAVVVLASALTAVFLARIGHTSQARLLAAWPTELPLPPAALGAGLLGALAFGDEFRHPALAADRGTVPRRLGLLTAKLVVAALTALTLAFLTVGCNAEVLYVLYGREFVRVPTDWLALSTGWLGLVIGCAWAGVLAAGVFRSTTAGLAAVLAVPVVVVPVAQRAVGSASVRTAAGLSLRLREVLLVQWPFGGERYLFAAVRVLAQPVGSALVLSLAALLCAYLLTTLRSRVR
jgi:ABC-type multidrug transport system ATPase subunit